jgi:hypothetical protein
MLHGSQWINLLQKRDLICQPYCFDRVEINGKTTEGQPVSFSIIGKCFSEFKSGPNLCILANIAGCIFGTGYYGLKNCRYLGFQV